MQVTSGLRPVEALTLQRSNTQPYRAMGSDLALREQVESLYQQAVSSDQEFCIDLEGEAPDGRPVLEWMGYSRKDNAKASLSKLIEGVDYLALKVQEQVRHQGGFRAVTKERILFSRDGFKQWGMLAGTDRGRQIRLYFIECEKRLQLGMAQPTALNQVMAEIALAHKDLTQAVTHGFNRLGAEISEVKAEQVAMRQDIDCLKRHQHKRKPAPAKHRRIYQQVVREHYGGACPCCHRHRLPLQEEHWFDRSLNGIDQMWLVCRECNDELGVAGSPGRQAKKKQFDAFQGFVHFHSIGMQIELL